jgi:hypothetical protein
MVDTPSDGGIVAVNIQYRLGLLGFLASSTIMSDGVANAGLQDQRAAFEWVQRHISSFGGDPNHVTISVSRPYVTDRDPIWSELCMNLITDLTSCRARARVVEAC